MRISYRCYLPAVISYVLMRSSLQTIRMPKLAKNENLPMKTLKLTLLIVLVSASTILSAGVQVTPITLEAAKEQGRANPDS